MFKKKLTVKMKKDLMNGLACIIIMVFVGSYLLFITTIGQFLIKYNVPVENVNDIGFFLFCFTPFISLIPALSLIEKLERKWNI